MRDRVCYVASDNANDHSACGKLPWRWSSNAIHVTCKRCLAKMAKSVTVDAKQEPALDLGYMQGRGAE